MRLRISASCFCILEIRFSLAGRPLRPDITPADFEKQ
jgi:hypothetical protein